MAVSLPCYCTREDVKLAPDFAETARGNTRIDRAIDSVSRSIEAELHRVFYPRDATLQWDWPGASYAYPWRLWFDQWDLIGATDVQSPPGTSLGIGNIIFRPLKRRPGWPFTHLEIDRSTSAAFGGGPTPQKAIQIVGTWGFTADTDRAGTLAAAITSTSAASCTVSDSSLMGVGDLIIIDGERMVVTEKSLASTGQVQQSGCSAPSAGDNQLTVTDGTKFGLGEMLLLDAERMLVEDISGNVLVVKRARDGSVLAVHGGAAIFAYRLLTVLRGQLGTTAATHSNGAAVSRHRPPGLVRDLAIAESVNRILQETSGYARTVGEGDGAHPAPGAALADLWDEAVTAYGRKARIRAV